MAGFMVGRNSFTCLSSYHNKLMYAVILNTVSVNEASTTLKKGNWLDISW